MAQEPAGGEPRSIYIYILENTKDGRLPEGFSIPWLESMWAPGAEDGVALYHMYPIENTPDPERDRKHGRPDSSIRIIRKVWRSDLQRRAKWHT